MDKKKKSLSRNLNENKGNSYRAKHSSPLRSKSKPKTGSIVKRKATIEEIYDDGSYDRKRQKELREQIAMKEKQL